MVEVHQHHYFLNQKGGLTNFTKNHLSQLQKMFRRHLTVKYDADVIVWNDLYRDQSEISFKRHYWPLKSLLRRNPAERSWCTYLQKINCCRFAFSPNCLAPPPPPPHPHRPTPSDVTLSKRMSENRFQRVGDKIKSPLLWFSTSWVFVWSRHQFKVERLARNSIEPCLISAGSRGTGRWSWTRLSPSWASGPGTTWSQVLWSSSKEAHLDLAQYVFLCSVR